MSYDIWYAILKTRLQLLQSKLLKYSRQFWFVIDLNKKSSLVVTTDWGIIYICNVQPGPRSLPDIQPVVLCRSEAPPEINLFLLSQASDISQDASQITRSQSGQGDGTSSSQLQEEDR